MELSVRKAAAFLQSADDILILCHKNPDGDTLGSGYGLCHALRQAGKRARVLVNDPLPKRLRFLADGCPDEEFVPQAIVSTDIADEQLFGEKLAPYLGQVDLAIDHHPSNTGFAKRLCLDAGAAATCEVIVAILTEMGLPIQKETADCLYTGIATDCGCFVYSNTTPNTHRVAATLIEAGCDYKRINKALFETKSMEVLATEREVLNTLEFHFENQVALMLITREMLAKTGVLESELDGIASIPRKIEGVEIGVTIKERGENDYKISLRSGERVNVSTLCQTLGGGGHARAAGCSISGTLDEVKTVILGEVGRALEENA